ncbi:competence/damage-inducible protein A [Chitinibacter bivalviorum]|uniref:Competence/damage-inducible protein A n=2 Tax=Chitinibacter bivalviorum TaxID=2739434 RepID=A0A7H9BNX4_9NEIS|nr:competence/damage-inducible protein A [Chitinibacter bivalviorum]
MAQFQVMIIGDEILSGRRQDQHFAVALKTLQAHGHQLAGVRYLPDTPAIIVRAFAETLRDGANVISFGGIGATPDDHTRLALATAAGVELVRHLEAAALIEAKFAEQAYPHRIHMADFPDGSSLIPNPVNQVAGAFFRQHALLPGFPSMAWPMLEWVLTTHYQDGALPHVCSVIVPDGREGELVGVMQTLVSDHPTISFSSLPSFGNARHATPHIEFSTTGEKAAAEAAMHDLKAQLDACGLLWFVGK